MFLREIDSCVLDPAWCSKDAIINYVKRARMIIQNEVSKGKVNTRLLSLALEHERMQQEKVTYLIVQDRKLSFERSPHLNTLPMQNRHYQNDHNKNGTLKHNVSRPHILIEAEEAHLGVNPLDLTTFTWDNEGPSFNTKISRPFIVCAKAVSVKDFLSFIIHEGYKKKSLWREDDLAFFLEKGFDCPATWSVVNNEYYVHGVDSTKHWTEVAEDAVYLSLAEAEAFCNWMSCRIMTESEYHRVLDCNKYAKISIDNNQDYQKLSFENFLEDKTPSGNLRKHKVNDIRGGGWEWTSSEFHPFPGFEAMPEYVKHSTDFFDGKHYVL